LGALQVSVFVVKLPDDLGKAFGPIFFLPAYLLVSLMEETTNRLPSGLKARCEMVFFFARHGTGSRLNVAAFEKIQLLDIDRKYDIVTPSRNTNNHLSDTPQAIL
jgi:hypothetical protein